MNTQPIAVIVKDYISNKITKYPSIYNCAEELSIIRPSIMYKLNRTPGVPTKFIAGYCIVVDNSEEIKWPIYDKEEAKKDRSDFNDIKRTVYGKNLKTGELRKFNNRNHVINFIGGHYVNIIEMLNAGSIEKVSFIKGWYFSYNKNINWAVVERKWKDSVIFAKNYKTGEILAFDNLNKAAIHFNTNMDYISNRCKLIIKSLFRKEWYFKKGFDTDWINIAK